MFFLQSQACLNFMRLVCKKQFFRAWKNFFCKGFSEFQRVARKKNRAWKIDFSQLQARLNPALCSKGKEREWEGKMLWRKGSCSSSALFGHLKRSVNVLASPSLSTYRYCVDWKQSLHVRKNNFSEFEQLFFCKASVFFKLLGKTMFQAPSLSKYRFCVDWKQSTCAKKNRSLQNCFSAKPDFIP